LVREGNFLDDSGYRLAREILKENVTAIFCANDVMAISAIKAIKETGLSVPDDISVIGFDNTAIGNYIMPALTTVNAPWSILQKHVLSHEILLRAQTF